MWYFKVQILNYKDVKHLKKQTTDLWKFCKYFDLELKATGVFGDSYYISNLPVDPQEACLIINALEAYFYFYDIANRFSWDDSDGPLEEGLGEIDEVFVNGEWQHRTRNS